ncbi:MAG: hypothetical protein U5L11_09020 [Arhodomonas sp.]|nr:hypothetical protein [Arhodomonas sp.]
MMVGVVGYLVLVFGGRALPPPGTDDPLAMLAVITRLAPVWLVLWLAAGAGGAIYNRRHTGSFLGRGMLSARGRDRLVCPVCGAPQVIRRGPGGQPRRVCSEAGEAHDRDDGQG